MTWNDYLAMEPPAPKRPRGRPQPDALTRERRRLAAWLVESGLLERVQVELLTGAAKRTVNRWRSANRRRAS